MLFLRKICLAFLMLFPAAFAMQAQELSQVSFSGGSNLTSIAFMTEQGVLIRVSIDGELLEYGIETRALRGDYYAPRLQPFGGRIDFYGPEADTLFRGRVKMIGTCTITYYGPFENETHAGKVRSIGTTFLDYYNQYENKDIKGKLKYAGSQMIDYYSAFENESYRGKLKNVGSTLITYYSNFDDRMNAGKIKSIGAARYTWYSSMDRSDMGGALKTGLYRQRVNGITWVIQ